MLDATEAPVVGLDGDGRITDASEAAERVLGPLRGRELADAVAAEDRDAFHRARDRCRAEGSARVAVRVGGNAVPMIASLHGGGDELVVVLRLPEPTPAPYGVIAVDGDGEVTFADAVAVTLVGERVPAALRRLAERLLATPGSAGPEVVEVGSRSIRAMAMRPADDGVVVLVVEDVTASVQHDRVMHEFLRNAAHQIRTPIAGILAAAEMLQSGAKESADDRDLFIGHIEAHATRLAQIGRGLMTLARVRAGQQPPLDSVPLRPLFDTIVLAAGADVAVACPPLLAAIAAPDLLREIVSALVENAVEHGGGADVRLAAQRSGERVVITVADAGPGIPSDAAPLVFEPFFRGGSGDERGFGLGLAIAAQAVAAMNGSIDVSATPGGGTTFTVTLPAATASP
jgi:signal transduction histidine kinase